MTVRLNEIEAEVLRRYEGGESAAAIARDLGRCPTGVQRTVRALRSLKLVTRPKPRGGRPRGS